MGWFQRGREGGGVYVSVRVCRLVSRVYRSVGLQQAVPADACLFYFCILRFLRTAVSRRCFVLLSPRSRSTVVVGSRQEGSYDMFHALFVLLYLYSS